ncbi:hypothetical protein [Microbacterium sp. 18062]|uniref:hypothetical protein n=1 Tax=Microbacterium sp. 18062 TaxID=2681410 RepID=UPI00135985A0|nr:hypothetical protein [Microbacterium sp. 18062]
MSEWEQRLRNLAEGTEWKLPALGQVKTSLEQLRALMNQVSSDTGLTGQTDTAAVDDIQSAKNQVQSLIDYLEHDLPDAITVANDRRAEAQQQLAGLGAGGLSADQERVIRTAAVGSTVFLGGFSIIAGEGAIAGANWFMGSQRENQAKQAVETLSTRLDDDGSNLPGPPSLDLSLDIPTPQPGGDDDGSDFPTGGRPSGPSFQQYPDFNVDPREVPPQEELVGFEPDTPRQPPEVWRPPITSPNDPPPIVFPTPDGPVTIIPTPDGPITGIDRVPGIGTIPGGGGGGGGGGLGGIGGGGGGGLTSGLVAGGGGAAALGGLGRAAGGGGVGGLGRIGGAGVGAGGAGRTGGLAGGLGGAGRTGGLAGGVGGGGSVAGGAGRTAGAGRTGGLAGGGVGGQGGTKGGGGRGGSSLKANAGGAAGRGVSGTRGGTGAGGAGAANGAGARGGGTAAGGGAPRGAGDRSEKKGRGLGGPIAPKLDDDAEFGPRSEAAGSGGRD